MTKSEFEDAVAQASGQTKVATKAVVSAIFGEGGVLERAMKGDGLSLANFGKFAAPMRAARTARNPATGESIQVPAKKVPKFTPSAGLKARL